MHFVCPWHGYEYDMKTGECVSDRRLKLKKYEVVQKGVTISMSLPESATRRLRAARRRLIPLQRRPAAKSLKAARSCRFKPTYRASGKKSAAKRDVPTNSRQAELADNRAGAFEATRCADPQAFRR